MSSQILIINMIYAINKVGSIEVGKLTQKSPKPECEKLSKIKILSKT